MADDMVTDGPWRIERKIPVALLGMMALQTFALIIWATRLESRVTYLEQNNVNPAQFAVMSEKITQVQTNSADTKQDMASIKTDINNLKEEIRRSGFNGKR